MKVLGAIRVWDDGRQRPEPIGELIDPSGSSHREVVALGRQWGIANYRMDADSERGLALSVDFVPTSNAHYADYFGAREKVAGHRLSLRRRLLSALRQAPSRLAWVAVGVSAGAAAWLPELARRGWGL